MHPQQQQRGPSAPSPSSSSSSQLQTSANNLSRSTSSSTTSRAAGTGGAPASPASSARQPQHQSTHLRDSGPLAELRPADVDGHRRAQQQQRRQQRAAPAAAMSGGSATARAGQASGVERPGGSSCRSGSSPPPTPTLVDEDKSSGANVVTPTSSPAGEPSGGETRALRKPSVVSDRARTLSRSILRSSSRSKSPTSSLMVRDETFDDDHREGMGNKSGRDVAIDVDGGNNVIKRANLLRSRSSPLVPPPSSSAKASPAPTSSSSSSTGVLRRTASIGAAAAARTVRIASDSKSDRLPLYHGDSAANRRAGLRFGQQQQQTTTTTTSATTTQHHHSVKHTVSFHPGYAVHAIFLLFILYVMVDSKTKVDRSAAQLVTYRREEARVNAKIVEFETRARQLSVEVDRLRRDNDAMEEMKREKQDRIAQFEEDAGLVAAIQAEADKLRARDGVILAQVRQLEERIQFESKREVVDKFGPGPHRVEFALDFPNQPKVDAATGKALPTKFHVEMASLDDMAHSVQLFLEQVHHGLWDGCAFVWNPAHLVLASPHVHAVPNEADPTTLDIRTDDEKREEFVDTGYTSVSFQEYSPNFPHSQYTLGYAGRPGGPNFYVNTRDNSRVHGPEGRTANLESDPDGDADPCFAKVVAGFDAVDRMHAMPTRGTGRGWEQSAFRDNVFIRYAKILTSK